MKTIGAVSTQRHRINCKRCDQEFIAKDTKAKWCSTTCKQKGRNNRKWQLKYMYGITEEQYNELFKQQNGQCAVCKETVKLVVDHCHFSGEVRGLLCHFCNTGLGCFRDDPERLAQAIEYANRSFKRNRRGGMA